MARRGLRAVIGVSLLCGLFGPTSAKAVVFTITLAGGVPGTSTPSTSSSFNYDAGTGGSLLGLNQFVADGSSNKAVTDGGSVFFGGSGLPVLFNLANGSAYIASPTAPTDASAAIIGNNPLSQTAPQAGGVLPSAANLLSISDSVAEGNGNRTLSAAVTSSDSTALGNTSITLGSDDWWVLGLSPMTTTDTGGENNNGGTPELPQEPPIPVPVPTPPPSPETTPEPSTIAMAALGAGAIGWWRRRKVKS